MKVETVTRGLNETERSGTKTITHLCLLHVKWENHPGILFSLETLETSAHSSRTFRPDASRTIHQSERTFQILESKPTADRISAITWLIGLPYIEFDWLISKQENHSSWTFCSDAWAELASWLLAARYGRYWLDCSNCSPRLQESFWFGGSPFADCQAM